MKINGINRAVTFPTLVRFFGTCDLIDECRMKNAE
jgi:hypothetical protein